MFQHDADFEMFFETARGQVRVLAECHILGSHLVLDELLFYPTQSREPIHPGVGEVLAIFREIRREAARAAFTEITIVYHRVRNGRPGRIMNFTRSLP